MKNYVKVDYILINISIIFDTTHVIDHRRRRYQL